MQVNIQEGKGLKQRKVPLSPILLSVLRKYYKKYKPQYYLFEGAGGKGTHLGITRMHGTKRHKSKSLTHRTLSVTVLPRTIWSMAPTC
jgi:integrase